MRRRRRDAGLGLDVADDVERERVGEVRPGAMVGDDLQPLVGGHRRVPALLRVGEALVESGVALREIRRVGRADGGELLLDRLADTAAVLRAEPVVRIALRVDVAHRAGDLPGRDLEDVRRQRGVEIAVGARMDPGIARLVDERLPYSKRLHDPKEFQRVYDTKTAVHGPLEERAEPGDECDARRLHGQPEVAGDDALHEASLRAGRRDLLGLRF